VPKIDLAWTNKVPKLMIEIREPDFAFLGEKVVEQLFKEIRL
jgi:hypothetical protein